MIRFDQVSKRYASGNDALSQISFELQQGEMAFLTGRSGAGKSTLLRLITRMESPSQGQVIVAGRNLNRLTRRQVAWHRRQIGVVFQDHQLLFDRDVFENVALPLKVSGYSKSHTERRVRAALDKVGLLGKEKMRPGALSGGEQQRVGIARAVVHRPAILLADEPTGNLDPLLSRDIFGLFEEFNQVGVCVLIASHDLGLVASRRRRIITLEQGRLIENREQRADVGPG
ncbi:MAG: cell division ATP-binding protein FtsE [Gammaproteobacteria bacterium]|nr:cell division ATP-binding protein FtsE [Pseudomonadales bacterium]MCP5347610.1 cell division ATP-binding protein FtsE [Pseudomonadales bacterium]